MRLPIARAVLFGHLGVSSLSLCQQPAAPPNIEHVATPQRSGYDQDITQPVLLPLPQIPLPNKKCKPKEERDESIQFSFYVDTDGRAKDIGFLRGLGNGLDQLAADLLNADRFKPGTFEDRPTAVWQTATVTFRACGKRTKDSTDAIIGEGWMTTQPVQTLGPWAAPDLVGQTSPDPVFQLHHIGRVSPPIPVHTPEARFSPEAREERISGVCLITLIVDTNGRPLDARIIRPLGHGLDEKALAAVNQYRFKPAMLDGKTPVPVKITIEVNFKLY